MSLGLQDISVQTTLNKVQSYLENLLFVDRDIKDYSQGQITVTITGADFRPVEAVIQVIRIWQIPVRSVEKPQSLKENSSLNIQCLNIETKVF